MRSLVLSRFEFSVDDRIIHSVKFPNNAFRLRDDSQRQPDKLSDIGLCIPHPFDLASVIRRCSNVRHGVPSII